MPARRPVVSAGSSADLSPRSGPSHIWDPGLILEGLKLRILAIQGGGLFLLIT